MADFVSGLNPNTPTYNDVVSQAAGEVRGIKEALKGSFPLFGEALNVGPEAISTYEDRIAALEDDFVSFVPRRIESGILDMGSANTTYTVTGLGFTPALLIVTGGTRGTISGIRVATGTYGFTDGINQHCVGVAIDFRAGNNTAVTSNTLLWQLYAAQGAAPPNDFAHQGVITSLDPNGFKISSTAGVTIDNRILWTAFE